jgi:hypothetical protein
MNEVLTRSELEALNGNIFGLPRDRNWKEEVLVDSNTLPFQEWVKEAVRQMPLQTSNVEEMDLRLLCRRPSHRATRYTGMKAFGNHFRVQDRRTDHLLTYDSDVASIFDVPSENAREVSINYVGILKDILKLDYGPLQTPVILMNCEWLKRVDNRGNSTYIRDEASFLVVNSRHKLPRMAEPFIFPSHATQVFFSDVYNKARWKVVLYNEARTKREVVDTTDVFITTTSKASELTVGDAVRPRPALVSLVGAIELSNEENLLANANY